MIFIDTKNILLICNRTYSDEIIRIQNFHFSRKIWWNNAENYRNWYVAENRILSKLSKISIQNCNNTNYRLIWRLCLIYTIWFDLSRELIPPCVDLVSRLDVTIWSVQIIHNMNLQDPTEKQQRSRLAVSRYHGGLIKGPSNHHSN